MIATLGCNKLPLANKLIAQLAVEQIVLKFAKETKRESGESANLQN